MSKRRLPKSVFDALFPRLRAGGFAKDYFPNRPLVAHGPLSRLGALGQDPRLTNPLSVIEAAATDLVVGYLTMGNGQRHQAHVTKATAKALFKDGLTVDAAELHRTVDVVADWVTAMARELGLGPDRIICDAIVSPGGDSVPMHFDGVETLCIQLTGCKHWRIAPCPDVAFPHGSVFPGLVRNWRDGDIPMPYAPDLPNVMPADAKSFVLRPGSACFLPRGWWHETRASEPSISLSVVLRTPTWENIFREALAGELMMDAAWRAPVALATVAQRTAAIRQASTMLRSASQLIAGLAPERLLEPQARFGRVAGAALACNRTSEDPGLPWTIAVTAPGNQPAEFAVDDGVARIIRWISRRRSPFSLRALEKFAHPSDPKRVVETLVQAGFLGLHDRSAETGAST